MNSKQARLRDYQNFVKAHTQILTTKEAFLSAYYYIRMEKAIESAAREARKIDKYLTKLNNLSMTVHFRKQLEELL